MVEVPSSSIPTIAVPNLVVPSFSVEPIRALIVFESRYSNLASFPYPYSLPSSSSSYLAQFSSSLTPTSTSFSSVI